MPGQLAPAARESSHGIKAAVRHDLAQIRFQLSDGIFQVGNHNLFGRKSMYHVDMQVRDGCTLPLGVKQYPRPIRLASPDVGRNLQASAHRNFANYYAPKWILLAKPALEFQPAIRNNDSPARDDELLFRAGA
jgi:hypothetical protein